MGSHEEVERIMKTSNTSWGKSNERLQLATYSQKLAGRERERESWLSGAFGWDSSRHDDLQIEGSIDKMCLKISIVQEG